MTHLCGRQAAAPSSPGCLAGVLLCVHYLFPSGHQQASRPTPPSQTCCTSSVAIRPHLHCAFTTPPAITPPIHVASGYQCLRVERFILMLMWHGQSALEW